MSSVLKRTCFYSVVDGKMRPHEWAMINVEGFGAMIEPFWPFESFVHSRGTDKAADDFTSEDQRVDEFVQVEDNKLSKMLSFDGSSMIHGGRNYPRAGR